MADIFDFAAAVSAEIATLTRLVPVPVEPFGYGRDLATRVISGAQLDITETAEDVDPFSVEGISQSLLRRLTTPKGSLPDDLDYGEDVTGYLNRGTTVQDLLTLEGRVKAEIMKDDRVSSATVTVTYSNETLEVSARIEPEDPNLGTFDLTFALTDGELLLKSLSR